MPDPAIGRRYAHAFIEIADEAGRIDEFADELAKFVEIAKLDDALLYRALCNPVFTVEERRAVLEAVLKKVKGLDRLTQNLLRVLIEKHRFGALFDLEETFRTMADGRAGRVNVDLVTASPLTAQLEAELRAAFEKRTGMAVTLNASVDPSLIGGMVARVQGTVYDSSIKSRLQDIKQALLTTQV
jgi:F-type H+-transporting ATPase subunit delta